MYSHSKTQVKLIDKLSAVIDILIGTEQGHPMSPELFKVYIHELSELLEAAGAITPLLNNIPVSHLLWADDLILMALDQESLQKLLNCLNEFCTNWGLSVNPDKTKVMVFNKSGKSYHSDKEFSLGKVKLQHTSTYCYLGLQFNTGGTFNLATEELRKKSIRAYFGLKRTVDISSLSFKSLTRLYDSLIKPILTYGCVVWLPYSSIFKALTEVSESSSSKNYPRTPWKKLTFSSSNTPLVFTRKHLTSAAGVKPEGIRLGLPSLNRWYPISTTWQ